MEYDTNDIICSTESPSFVLIQYWKGNKTGYVSGRYSLLLAEKRKMLMEKNPKLDRVEVVDAAVFHAAEEKRPRSERLKDEDGEPENVLEWPCEVDPCEVEPCELE